MRYPLIFLLIALFLTGCVSSLDKFGYIPKTNLEKEIAELKVTNAKDLQLKQAELKKSLEEVITAKNNQIQEASNSAWAADNAFRFYKAPERLDLIINNRVKESLAALGLGPTLEAVQAENIRLAEELDESKISLDQLKVNHQAKIAENAALVAATKQHELIVARLEREKIDIERAGLEKLIGKQDELNAANNIIIEKEKENSENKKYIEANKTRISIASGLLAIACVAGAFFSPIFKDKLALGAALFGAISVGIIFLAPWHVAVFFGVIFIGAGAWFLRKHFISNKTNENLINVFQNIKENASDIYKIHVKPELEEWNKKYTKTGEKVEDKVVTAHIEEILKDYERK